MILNYVVPIALQQAVTSVNFILDNIIVSQIGSVAIAALLLKPNKAKLNFEIDWVGFEIPDEFVVGYGLDYNQKFRNLKGIYQGIEI